MAVTTMIGAKIHRREDPRLITGHGHYVDDMTLTGMVHMAVVRSPHAHARIKSIGVAQAGQAPGVLAVFTAADFEKVIAGGLPTFPAFVPEKKQTPAQRPIAKDEVVYQGEPVVVVVAESRSQAADAAALVDVDYEVLTAVMDIEKAMQAGGPTAHVGASDNIAWEATFPGGDIDAAFAEAEVVVKERIHQQRLAPVPMEGRAVVADHTPFDNRLTLYTSSQVPHFIRLLLAGGLGMPESNIRVVAPDVGGGFGSKLRIYPEEYLAPAVSKLVARPVKWVEGRSENLLSMTQGRGQIFDIEVAAKKDGTLLGLKITQLYDCGAYVADLAAFQAVAILIGGGVYPWKAVHGRSVAVLTNKMQTNPYRGAGRPEGTHLVERAVDLVAAEIGMDPAEIRRKNFVKNFPHANNFGLVYDSGDYVKSLDKALSLAGYKDLRREQETLRKQGRYLGVGLSTYVEICGLGPSAATAPATGGLALTESANVRVTPTGSVVAWVGTHSHGQGHDTTFPQILADEMGVPIDSIELRHGDTAEGPGFGLGTYGSRSLAVGGVALKRAAAKVIDKMKKLAAHQFEAAEEDIVFDQGNFYVKGSPDNVKPFGAIAFAAYGAGLPPDMELGLDAISYFDPPNFVWPFGAHVCVVEVDADTGAVDIRKYIAVDDCGNVINPMIVDGQLHGGIVQGIAQALFEEVVYDDESGQLRTGTLTDYLVPTANEIPEFILDKTVTPSPTNELGVKGIGEAGTIAASAAVINAIVDALTPFGIKHVDMPASPDRLWKQIHTARGSQQDGHDRKEARK
jgi:aerobic carbon-monoxide dehydrogenase large subunit